MIYLLIGVTSVIGVLGAICAAWSAYTIWRYSFLSIGTRLIIEICLSLFTIVYMLSSILILMVDWSNI